MINDSLRESIAGAFAGASSKTLFAPMDRLKLIVQLRGSISQVGNLQRQNYDGPVKAFRAIIKEEGFLALWRGNLSTVLIQAGTTGLNFMFMDIYKKAAVRLVGVTEHQSTRQQQVFQSFLAGGLTGFGCGKGSTFVFKGGEGRGLAFLSKQWLDKFISRLLCGTDKYFSL